MFKKPGASSESSNNHQSNQNNSNLSTSDFLKKKPNISKTVFENKPSKPSPVKKQEPTKIFSATNSPKPFNIDQVKNNSLKIKCTQSKSSSEQTSLLNFFAKNNKPQQQSTKILDEEDDFLEFINSKPTAPLKTKPNEPQKTSIFNFNDKKPIATVKPQLYVGLLFFI